MATESRIKDGRLLLAGEVNERLPVVQDGLVAHYPFDGHGGCFDSVGGNLPTTNQASNVNLADALNWTRPESWGDLNNHESAPYSSVTWDEDEQAITISQKINSVLRIPIVIDPTKTYNVSLDIRVVDRGDGAHLTYIGGNRDSADHLRTTSNYDYSIRAGWQPTEGEWESSSKTYSTGLVRYSSGWYCQSDTNASGAAYTKYWYFGGLWNYSSTGDVVTQIRNLKIWVSDTDVSNTTITYDGLGVEEATTNEFNFTDFATGANGWSAGYEGKGVEQTSAEDPFGQVGVNKVYRKIGKIRIGNTTGTDIGTLYNGNTYTFSVYLRHVKGLDEQVNMEFDLYDRQDSVNFSGSLGSNMTYEWKRFTVTALHNNSANYHFIDLGTYQSTATFEWCCPQIENKSFPTSFVNGSRSSDGLFNIQNAPINTSVGSLRIKAQLTNNNAYSAGFKSLFGNRWGSCAFFMFMNDSTGLLYGYHPNNAAGHSHFTTSITPAYLDIVDIVCAWNGTSFKMYLNGILLQTHTDCDMTRVFESQPDFYIGSHIGSSYDTFGIIKELSFYDKELTQTDVTALHSGKSQVNDNGLITNEIIELDDELNPNVNFTDWDYTDLITNGDMSSATGWSLLNGSTIASGIATVIAAGTISYSGAYWSLRQNDVFSLDTSDVFILTFDAKQTVGSGTFQAGIGYYQLFDQTITTTMTTYSVVCNAYGTWDDLSFGGRTAGDEFEIDNVSLSKLAAPTGWTIAGAMNETHYISEHQDGLRVFFDTTTPVISIILPNVFTIGQQYKIKYTITESSGIGVKSDNFSEGTYYLGATVGTFSDTLTAAATSLAFYRAGSGIDFVLSKLSISTIDQDMAISGETLKIRREIIEGETL